VVSMLWPVPWRSYPMEDLAQFCSEGARMNPVPGATSASHCVAPRRAPLAVVPLRDSSAVAPSPPRVPTVEPAHEAILTEWPRLADWIKQHRKALGQDLGFVSSARILSGYAFRRSDATGSWNEKFEQPI
jgi:hypothetical protein